MHLPNTYRTIMRRIISLAAVFALALAPAAFAQDGSAITIAQTVDATSLDPAFRDNTRTGNLILHVFDPIVMRTADMELEPWLAESVEQIDETTWRVTLREGIQFGNGEPLDAEAVTFSLDRILDPETQAPTRRWFTNITNVEVVDDLTLEFTTETVDPLFPVRLTFLFPVPPQHFQEVGADAFSVAPVGTGPYDLVEWERDDHITLQAKDDYWWGDVPIQSVIFRIVPEEVARVSALETGEADLIESISPDQANYLANVAGVRVESAPSTRAVVLSFDTDVPPADNVNFRRAVGHAINTDVLIEGLYEGYAESLNSFLSPAIPAWPQDQDYTFGYDPERARQLLEEEGLADAEIVLRSATAYPIFRNLALALASMLEEVGLTVEVTSEEWSAWFDDLQAKDMSAVYLNDHGNVWIDPAPQIDAFFHSEGFLSTYGNPQVDEMLAESNTLSGDARSEIFGDMLEILVDDAAAVPLLSQVSLYGVAVDLVWEPRPDGVIFALEMELESSD